MCNYERDSKKKWQRTTIHQNYTRACLSRFYIYIPFSVQLATQSRTIDSSLTYFCNEKRKIKIEWKIYIKEWIENGCEIHFLKKIQIYTRIEGNATWSTNISFFSILLIHSQHQHRLILFWSSRVCEINHLGIMILFFCLGLTANPFLFR